MSTLTRFGVAMDGDLLARFDELVARRGTGINRSEAVRDLVRDALVDAEWEDASGEVVATFEGEPGRWEGTWFDPARKEEGGRRLPKDGAAAGAIVIHRGRADQSPVRTEPPR